MERNKGFRVWGFSTTCYIMDAPHYSPALPSLRVRNSRNHTRQETEWTNEMLGRETLKERPTLNPRSNRGFVV